MFAFQDVYVTDQNIRYNNIMISITQNKATQSLNGIIILCYMNLNLICDTD